MKYAYEDLSSEQFEKLIVFLCQKLLGISVQGFSKGPDGGRDAKFMGTAELHPSKTAPWVGTTIIQAKHTNGYNRDFSESDFFSTTSKTAVLGEEIPVLIQRNWHFSDLHRSRKRPVLLPNIQSLFPTDLPGGLEGRFSVLKFLCNML